MGFFGTYFFAGALDAAEEWRYDWEWTYSRDDYLDVVPTQGGHNHRPPDQLADQLAGLGAAIDTLGGSFTMRYATLAFAARTVGG